MLFTFNQQTRGFSISGPQIGGPGGKAVFPGNPGLKLFHPPTAQTISSSPAIFWIPDFLSPEECDHLVKLATDKLAPSCVVNNADGESVLQKDMRTSFGTFLRFGQDETVQAIEARIASLTHIPMDFGEALQVLNYQEGQEYKAHCDYFESTVPGQARTLEAHGQRVATLLMYLNDVPQGGETAFPNLDVRITPQKGAALLFYNVAPNGDLDPNTLHASLPVEAGEKWLATKWMRERACPELHFLHG